MWLDLGAPQHPHKQTILYKKVDIAQLFLVQCIVVTFMKSALEFHATIYNQFLVTRNEKGPFEETCCLSGQLCSPADSCDTTQRDRVVELLLKGHTRQHWTDSLWWSIGSDLVSSHLARTCNRLLPWTCWTSSRITSPATPAVQLRTLFTVQEILYRVSCLEILSPGKMWPNIIWFDF